MSITRTVQLSGGMGGQSMLGNFSIAGNTEVGGAYDLPAADVGTITDGVITVTSNAGVPSVGDSTTGVVFWTDAAGVKKRRYNCAFAVAGAEITVTSGSGDTLPGSGYAVTVDQYHIATEVGFDGAQMTGIMASANRRCVALFNTSVPAVLLEMNLLVAGQAYFWGGIGTTPVNGTVGGTTAVVVANGEAQAAVFQWGAVLS